MHVAVSMLFSRLDFFESYGWLYIYRDQMKVYFTCDDVCCRREATGSKSTENECHNSDNDDERAVPLNHSADEELSNPSGNVDTKLIERE